MRIRECARQGRKDCIETKQEVAQTILNIILPCNLEPGEDSLSLAFRQRPAKEQKRPKSLHTERLPKTCQDTSSSQFLMNQIEWNVCSLSFCEGQRKKTTENETSSDGDLQKVRENIRVRERRIALLLDWMTSYEQKATRWAVYCTITKNKAVKKDCDWIPFRAQSKESKSSSPGRGYFKVKDYNQNLIRRVSRQMTLDKRIELRTNQSQFSRGLATDEIIESTSI